MESSHRNVFFIILAHDSPEQLGALVSAIAGPQSRFVIHVDARRSIKPFLRQLQGISNVFFLRKRYKIELGSFEMVQATLDALEEILSRKERFSHAVLLSGRDYPIKSKNFIMDFFNAHPEAVFLDAFPLPCNFFYGGGHDRVDFWHFHHIRWKKKRFVFPKKQQCSFDRKNFFFPFTGRWPFNLIRRKRIMPFYAGSQWWAIPYDAAVYVQNYLKEHPKTTHFFKHVLIPDELFFHSILMNSPFRPSVVLQGMNFLNWPKRHHGPYPNSAYLDETDADFVQLTPHLFARKFDPAISRYLIEDIKKRCGFS